MLRNKMFKKMFSLLLAFSLLFSVVGCETRTVYSLYEYSFFGSFDTEILFKCFARDNDEFSRLAEQVRKRFTELNRLYDIYHDYSGINNLKTINDQAGGEAVAVAPEIISMLQLGVAGYERSAGLVDITLGPVLEIWHDLRLAAVDKPRSAKLPTEEQLQAAYALCGIEDLEIDAAAGTVRLKREGMALNVGAIAKGYATELIARELRAAGATSFLISAGGNVRAVGAPLDGRRQRWGVGLKDPLGLFRSSVPDGEATLDVAFVRDASVVSSGGYERYFEVSGERYHHLIDPRTLYPGDNYLAVTVITEDSGWADFYSTAVFLMSPEEAFAFAEREGGLALFLVLPDGELLTNLAMDKLLASKGATATEP